MSTANPAGSITIVKGTDQEAWLTTLRRSAYYDFYHLPFYHALAEELHEGEPQLLVYVNGDYTLALPLLFRRITEMPIGCGEEKPLFDATSSYGYVGPLSSHVLVPDEILSDFHEKLITLLVQSRVVSVFSRLHPFFPQSSLLTGLGRVVVRGHTVSIDLGLTETEQLAQYRGNHRREINRLVKLGGTCIVDVEFRYLDRFADLYYETMERVGATREYLYPRDFFRKLVATSEADVRLLVALIGDQVAAAALFVKCGDIVEYHLGGTSSAHLKHSPMKLVVETARHWACSCHARVLHLGGGVGSSDDSLAHFKSGFSKRTHSFSTWRWIVLPAIYGRLVALSARGGKGPSDPESDSFFPAYRAPPH